MSRCTSVRVARPGMGGPPTARPDRRRDGERGFLSLEWVLTLPVMVLLAALVVAAGYLVRDVLVMQEAARVGARVASTTVGNSAATAAARDAAPELGGGLSVSVTPQVRRPGDRVEVVVSATRSYGPLRQRLRARSTAQVEPTVEGRDPLGPIDPRRRFDPPGTSAPWG